MFNFEEESKKLPRKPGVYIMRDDKDVILYVGKAINLHNRVRSYFRENIGRGPAIDQMVSLIARFEYIVTDSELEALVLENNLIKENSPKYNTLLKDDKTYPYIKVTVGRSSRNHVFTVPDEGGVQSSATISSIRYSRACSRQRLPFQLVNMAVP